MAGSRMAMWFKSIGLNGAAVITLDGSEGELEYSKHRWASLHVLMVVRRTSQWFKGKEFMTWRPQKMWGKVVQPPLCTTFLISTIILQPTIHLKGGLHIDLLFGSAPSMHNPGLSDWQTFVLFGKLPQKVRRSVRRSVLQPHRTSVWEAPMLCSVQAGTRWKKRLRSPSL